jgi:hypothetical protein
VVAGELGSSQVSETMADVVPQDEGGPEPERCALQDCEVGLPARGLDEHGRAKGGRRPRYCCKTHADTASRQRRVRDLAAVADPLAQARAVGQVVLPAAQQLATDLRELIARFDQAEAGALARVVRAEQEAAAAVVEATVARGAAEAAEQGRRQAVSDARQDRQARDNAVREAERARQGAEQIRSEAWARVAAHERARGQSEAARAAAEGVAEALAAENRLLRERLEGERAAGAELGVALATTGQELERSRGESLALSVRLEVVEHERGADADRLRERDARLRELQDRLREQDSRLREQDDRFRERDHRFREQDDRGRAQVAGLEDRAAGLLERVTLLEERAGSLRAELAVQRSARELDLERLADSRRALAASEERLGRLHASLDRLGHPPESDRSGP